MSPQLCRGLPPATAMMVAAVLVHVAQQALDSAAAEIDPLKDKDAAAVCCDVADALAGVWDLIANAGEGVSPCGGGES